MVDASMVRSGVCGNFKEIESFKIAVFAGEKIIALIDDKKTIIL